MLFPIDPGSNVESKFLNNIFGEVFCRYVLFRYQLRVVFWLALFGSFTPVNIMIGWAKNPYSKFKVFCVVLRNKAKKIVYINISLSNFFFLNLSNSKTAFLQLLFLFLCLCMKFGGNWTIFYNPHSAVKNVFRHLKHDALLYGNKFWPFLLSIYRKTESCERKLQLCSRPSPGLLIATLAASLPVWIEF